MMARMEVDKETKKRDKIDPGTGFANSLKDWHKKTYCSHKIPEKNALSCYYSLMNYNVTVLL